MILLVFLATILIIGTTIYQYDEQTKEYNISRFGRKEEALKKEITVHLNERTEYDLKTENLGIIFQEVIRQIAYIHNLEISIYDLEGILLKTSFVLGLKDGISRNLTPQKISRLKANKDSRIFEIVKNEKINIQTSYTYILSPTTQRIGILKLEFNQDNSTQEYELKEFLARLILVYFFMLIIGYSW